MHSAPGKLILFGEHAVVYGQPAIAMPFNAVHVTAKATHTPPGTGLSVLARDLDLALHVIPGDDTPDNALTYAALLVLRTLHIANPPDLSIEIRSTIPFGSGFGSGAAVSAALMRELSSVLGHPLEGDTLNDLVYEVEKIHHGTPSGIDNTVIVRNTPIYFVREKPIQNIKNAVPLTFVVADTGIPAPTKETVGRVRELVMGDPKIYRPYIDQIGQIVDEARTHMEKGYLLGIGHLMNLNHNVLRSLEVSSPILDKLTNVANEAGALGAKLSGGGRGGNIIALVDAADAKKVRAALNDSGAMRTWIATLERTEA
jgi:mevalonate kinase